MTIFTINGESFFRFEMVQRAHRGAGDPAKMKATAAAPPGQSSGPNGQSNKRSI